MFLLNRGMLEGRFDATYYSPERRKFLERLRSNPLCVKLKTVIATGSYGVLPPSERYGDGGDVTLIRATELDRDLKINLATSPKVPQEYFRHKRAQVRVHDILLAVKGATIASEKCVCFVEESVENAIVNGSIFRMRAVNHVSPKYLAYVLDSPLAKRQMKINLIANNAVDYLDLPLIHNLLVPVPRINVQEEIVLKLDETYAEKCAKEAEAIGLLKSVDAYVLGRLGITLPAATNDGVANRIFYANSGEVLGGRFDPAAMHPERVNAANAIRAGKYQCDALYSVARFSKITSDKKEAHLPYVGLENVEAHSGWYVPTGEVLEFGTASVFKQGQVLFPKLRPYLNKVFFAPFDGVCSTEFHVLDGIKVSNSFLAHFLRTSVILTQTKRLMTGNTLPRLQTQEIESLLISLPPPRVQDEIVAHVEEIYAEAKRLRREGLEKLEAVKREVEAMLLGSPTD